MNIFTYDPDPTVAALWIDDVRRNKMITEHGQMFTAALDYLTPGWSDDAPENRINYPASVMMHPCSIWLRQSWANMEWLRQLNQAYLDSWGTHASNRIMKPVCEAIGNNHTGSEPTEFANAARSRAINLDFTHLPVHTAYREYHCARWSTDKRAPTWKRGQQPDWYRRTIICPSN